MRYVRELRSQPNSFVPVQDTELLCSHREYAFKEDATKVGILYSRCRCRRSWKRFTPRPFFIKNVSTPLHARCPSMGAVIIFKFHPIALKEIVGEQIYLSSKNAAGIASNLDANFGIARRTAMGAVILNLARFYKSKSWTEITKISNKKRVQDSKQCASTSLVCAHIR